MAAQRLQLRLKQQLAMAPQLQQAIQLLQFNRLELRQHIQQILDANPLLERMELSEDNWEEVPEEEEEEQTEEDSAELAEADEEYSEEWDLPEGFSVTDGGYEGDFPQDNYSDDETSIQDHLLWQINLSPLSETDNAIAQAIVFALDEDGYLKDSITDIRASLAPDYLVDTEEVLAVLHRIQRMEPVGVATRDPQECLRVQLDMLPLDTKGRELARRIARQHIDLLVRGERTRLRRKLGVDDEALDTAIELIHSLDARPGARFTNRRDEYLAPDVYIRKHEGKWIVALNPENEPNLKLNSYYMGLLKSTTGKDAEYLKGRLQEARWLLSSLELRNRTLLNVTRCIVAQQEDFFENGEKSMRPMILKDISEDCGMHESTVSRATTRKYALTPRGLVELKYFFSSHVRTLDGKSISATAVKSHLQELILGEPAEKPLSDNALSQLLNERGIQVARRTIAKYRDALGIGTSSERRQAARRNQVFATQG